MVEDLAAEIRMLMTKSVRLCCTSFQRRGSRPMKSRADVIMQHFASNRHGGINRVARGRE